MRMQVFVWLLSPWFVYSAGVQRFTVEEYAGVTAGCKEVLRSSCVYVISPLELTADHKKVVNTLKHLSQKGVAASIVTFDNLEDTEKCNKFRPLNVIIADTPDTKSILSKQPQIPAYASWLVFVDTPLDTFLPELIIPFDCEFLLAEKGANGSVTLTEVYHVTDKSPLFRNIFGEWTRKTGVVRKSKGAIRDLRTNLQGMSIRAGIRHHPPNLAISYSANNTTIISGYFPEVWRVLEHYLNFTSDLQVSKRKEQGTKLPNGTWTGLMGMILRDDIDVAIIDFTLTIDRKLDFDYLLPLMIAVNRVFVRKPSGVNLAWDNFLIPFSPTLWMALIGSILTLALTLTAICKIGRIVGNEEAAVPPIITLSEALVFHYGLICQQGHDVTPQAMSGRIIYLIGAITAIIVMAAYSAKLIAFLTVQTTSFPVDSFEELMALKYELGVIPSSGQFASLQKTGHPLLKRVYNELILKNNKTDHLPNTFEDGLERICLQEKYGMLTSYELSNGMLDNISCKVAPLPSIVLPYKYAMLIAKRSPFTNVINRKLMRMHETGILFRMKSKVWPPKFEEDATLFVSVTLESATPMLTIVVLGICSSLFILSIEIFISKIRGVGKMDVKKAEGFHEQRHPSWPKIHRTPFVRRPYRRLPQKVYV